MYSWTVANYKNLTKGAQLRRIQSLEDAVHAAWVAGVVAKPKKCREKRPDQYFNAEKARKRVLEGIKKTDFKPDFTLYNQVKDDLKTFNFTFTPKE